MSTTRPVPNARLRQPPPHALREWYASLLGQSMMSILHGQVAEMLQGVFGYRGLQLGVIGSGVNLLENSGLYHALVAGENADDAGAQIVAGAEAMPFATGRLDLLLLLHTLDFSRQPHQVLREADRVLADDGHLLIVGFNPLGVWGPVRLLLRWRRSSLVWQCGFYSMTRTQDWLALLGFKTLGRRSFFFRPPVQRSGLLHRLRGLDRLQRWLPSLGAVYVVKARKQTVPLTPVRLRWRPRRSIVGAGFVRPANRVAGR